MDIENTKLIESLIEARISKAFVRSQIFDRIINYSFAWNVEFDSRDVKWDRRLKGAFDLWLKCWHKENELHELHELHVTIPKEDPENRLTFRLDLNSGNMQYKGKGLKQLFKALYHLG